MEDRKKPIVHPRTHETYPGYLTPNNLRLSILKNDYLREGQFTFGKASSQFKRGQNDVGGERDGREEGVEPTVGFEPTTC
jgi:hypothetical protein